MNDIMREIGRPFSHVELNNVATAADVLDILTASPQPINVLQERRQSVVAKLKMMSLPKNMHWVPSRRDLTSKLMAASSKKREDFLSLDPKDQQKAIRKLSKKFASSLDTDMNKVAQ
jgi:hypothetical protein